MKHRMKNRHEKPGQVQFIGDQNGERSSLSFLWPAGDRNVGGLFPRAGGTRY
jgi:hypothetical protein